MRKLVPVARNAFVCAFLSAAVLPGQQLSSQDVQKILDRLDTLEKQNQALLQEIHQLRDTIKQQQPAAEVERLDERVSKNEHQIEDQAQTKVGASQRLPISLTGMFLFDSFLTEGTDNYAYQSAYGEYNLGSPGGGATLRQSIIGLEFYGPQMLGGAHVHGGISMDFFSPNGENDVFRIRRGTVSFDWQNRTLTFGQDKSIIAPLEPTSFARVGIPPLSGSGNLWFWRPQVRYDERVALSSATQLTLSASVLGTDEMNAVPALPRGTTLDPIRPAIQGHIGLSHQGSDDSKLALGVAAHASESHVNGIAVPSRVVSADFLFKPASWFELSGTMLHGENFANLGGSPIGASVRSNQIVAVRGNAGWLQLAFPVTSRLTF
ncbi:MAG: hypothetical protein JO061_00820, partial [Acidobacteriaceae bacterium]|nr:hypothetical protein [Acidobacteriaceae bacterium]